MELLTSIWDYPELALLFFGVMVFLPAGVLIGIATTHAEGVIPRG